VRTFNLGKKELKNYYPSSVLVVVRVCVSGEGGVPFS